MADTLLLKAVRGNAKKVNLNNKNLTQLPKLIGMLSELDTLEARNNNLSSAPSEFSLLAKLTNLHLGNNSFCELPLTFRYLRCLRKLHLFNNNLTELHPDVIEALSQLILLNLNKNNLHSIPKEIGKLTKLEYLSLDDNKLTELPKEICNLSSLKEFSICNNQLVGLPDRIGKLKSMKKMFLIRNRLNELPDSMGKMYQLSILDVSVNNLKLIPCELVDTPLSELHLEGNPLITRTPVHCFYQNEVLPLKEIAARFILKDLKKRDSIMRFELRYNDDAREILIDAKECPVCINFFLNTWLECAEFVDAQKILGTKNRPGTIPLRVQLCSYKCFKSDGHNYLGVATQEVNSSPV